MKTLIDTYERRLETIQEMIEKLKFKDDANPNYVRLTTKRAEYRTFIAELKCDSKVIAEEVIEAVAQTIDSVQQNDDDSLTISNEDWFNDDQFEIMKKAVKITRFT